MACVAFYSCLYFYFFFFLFLSDMIPIIDCEGRRACICIYEKADISTQVFTFLIFLTKTLQDYFLKFDALNLKRTQPMAIALYSRTETK